MIAVIGGTGILGEKVSRQLLERGLRVRVMTRDLKRARTLQSAGAEVVQGDLQDAASVRAALTGVRVVVSAAHALLGGRNNASQRVDNDGQHTLIALAKMAGVSHFVYTSVLGAAPYHDVDFWRTKWRVEQQLNESGLPFTIVRPAAFIDLHAYELLGKAVLAGKRVAIMGPGTNQKNFVAASDVATLIVQAVADSTVRNQTIEIGGPENLSTLQVIAIFERVSGRKANVVHIPLPALRTLSRIIGLVHPGIGRVLQTAVMSETTDQTFDATAVAARFSLKLTSVEEWARAHCSNRPDRENHPGRPAAAT